MLVQIRNVLPPLPCLTPVAENPVKFPNDLCCWKLQWWATRWSKRFKTGLAV